MPHQEPDWPLFWRSAEQAVSSICDRSHNDWDDLLLAAVVGIWSLDDPSNAGIRYLTARRRAIDEWRKIGIKRRKVKDPHPISLDRVLESEDDSCFDLLSTLSSFDVYEFERESAAEVAQRLATNEREKAIFAVLADGGTKQQAADLISRHPARISQILADYRVRCS